MGNLIQKLVRIANLLDNNCKYIEADIVSDVLVRLGQGAPPVKSQFNASTVKPGQPTTPQEAAAALAAAQTAKQGLTTRPTPSATGIPPVVTPVPAGATNAYDAQNNRIKAEPVAGYVKPISAAIPAPQTADYYVQQAQLASATPTAKGTKGNTSPGWDSIRSVMNNPSIDPVVKKQAYDKFNNWAENSFQNTALKYYKNTGKTLGERKPYNTKDNYDSSMLGIAISAQQNFNSGKDVYDGRKAIDMEWKSGKLSPQKRFEAYQGLTDWENKQKTQPATTTVAPAAPIVTSPAPNTGTTTEDWKQVLNDPLFSGLHSRARQEIAKSNTSPTYLANLKDFPYSIGNRNGLIEDYKTRTDLSKFLNTLNYSQKVNAIEQLRKQGISDPVLNVLPQPYKTKLKDIANSNNNMTPAQIEARLKAQDRWQRGYRD